MTAPSTPRPSERSQRALDWLQFFIADVQTAFGPLIATYLAAYGWTQGAIGSVLTINTAVTLATEAPAGALADWVRWKRAVVAVCLLLIAAGSLLIGLFPWYVPVAVGEVLHGITGGAVRTALAAISLGLVGHRVYYMRVGRNHRYDSLGNAATALGMGLLGYFVSLRAPFFAAAALCLPALLALSFIRPDEIDYARARAAEGRREPKPARWRDITRNRPLLIFAACLFLFQFADSSMLPLAGERLATEHKQESEMITAALVAVPQIVTALIALLVARKADEWGRKYLLLLAFGALLARAALFAFAFSPWYLVCVQVLGGLTAAVIGILTPLIVADLTAHSGRYNFALGSVSMLSSVGAAISTTAIGFLAQELGFASAFVALAAVAALGLATAWWWMPETVESARSYTPSDTSAATPVS